MPDKFNPPADPAGALYHAATCGHIETVQRIINESPELIDGKPVVDGAWSHGARRCGAQDDVITCLWLLIEAGASFANCHVDTYDSAFKTHPRAARMLFEHDATASAADEDGTTSLHLMAQIGYRSAAKVLLQHGADVGAKNTAGETPLDIAEKLGHVGMAAFLRRAGDTAPGVNEVVWYRADRGSGYLRDDGIFGELFFDAECGVGEPPSSIEEGVPVRFDVTTDKFGLRATKVRFP